MVLHGRHLEREHIRVRPITPGFYLRGECLEYLRPIYPGLLCIHEKSSFGIVSYLNLHIYGDLLENAYYKKKTCQ